MRNYKTLTLAGFIVLSAFEDVNAVCTPVPAITQIYGTFAVCLNTTLPYSVTNTVGSTYGWTIVGGTKSSGGNTSEITVAWNTVGYGSIKVTETNSNGCTRTLTTQVYVNSPPYASAIAGLNSVCTTRHEPYSISTNGNCSWTIVGGTQISGGNTMSISVEWGATPGSGSVSVVVTDWYTGCTATVSMPVAINPKPAIYSISGPSEICSNSNDLYSVTYTAGSTYSWIVEGGSRLTGTNTNAGIIEWGAPGQGHITVYETTSTGCTALTGLYVTIRPLPTTSAISGSNSVCAGSTGVPYSVVGTVGSTYLWLVNYGIQSSGTNGPSITVDWGTAATPYASVRILETNQYHCVTNLVFKDVAILPSAGAVTGFPVSTCNSSAVALTGSPPGGSWSGTGVSGSTFYPSGLSPGNYTVTYTYTNPYGCSAAAPTTVTVLAEPTITNFTGVSQVCPGVVYNYSASSSAMHPTFFWTFPSGWTLQSGQSSSIQLLVPNPNSSYGAVTVRVTASNGCWAQNGITAYPGNCGQGFMMMAAPKSKVFPNPASTELFVELPGVEDKDVPVALYNENGARVATGMIKKGEAKATFGNLSLPTGHYTLEIRRSGKTEVERVVLMN